MTIKSLLTSSIAGLFIGLSTVASAGLVIDNSGSTVEQISPFGSTNTATYGEAFHTTGSAGVLNSFTMFLGDQRNGSGGLKFRGYIGSWDGSKVTSILYTSSDQTGAANTSYTFSPGINLSASTSYIAFLSISELAAQLDDTYYMPWDSSGDTDPLTDGFYFFNNGTDFAALTSKNWDNSGLAWGDVRLIADIGDARNVPEPSSMALLAIALLGTAALRRGRA